MLADDLPPEFARPFRYLFDGRLSSEERAVVESIESLRAAIARRTEIFDVAFPSSLRKPKPIRNGAWIAYESSVTRNWGTFLYLCAKSFSARRVLELGSCAGISGSYLAAAPLVEKLITVEGSPALARMAIEIIGKISRRAIVI